MKYFEAVRTYLYISGNKLHYYIVVYFHSLYRADKVASLFLISLDARHNFSSLWFQYKLVPHILLIRYPRLRCGVSVVFSIKTVMRSLLYVQAT